VRHSKDISAPVEDNRVAVMHEDKFYLLSLFENKFPLTDAFSFHLRPYFDSFS